MVPPLGSSDKSGPVPLVMNEWQGRRGDQEVILIVRLEGAWLTLVERVVRDHEVLGSNPSAPRFSSGCEVLSLEGMTHA